MKASTGNEFSLGAIIVPARNGLLQGLGFDVSTLGEKGLGIVTESKSSKCLVQFPELRLSVWLGHDEMADVVERAKSDEAYGRLWRSITEMSIESRPVVWWAHEMVSLFQASHILGIEKGLLNEIWSEDGRANLPDSLLASASEKAVVLSLGLPELVLSDVGRLEELTGGQLLSLRFLPAGMHKLECRIIFKDAISKSA